MDPNAALDKGRAALATMRAHTKDAFDATFILADAFEALDDWLTKGGFPPDAWNRTTDLGVTIAVYPSAGSDGAVVVQIDTPDFEPDGSDGGPGLRVLLNDSDAYIGVPYVDLEG